MAARSNRTIQPLSLHRFSAFAELAREEAEALGRLTANPVIYSRGQILRRENDPDPGLFFLHKGWAANYMTCAPGGRQYFTIHCAGDLMGASSVPLRRAADTLVTLTEAIVSALAPEKLHALFATHPRVAMMFFLAAQSEHASLMDHLASLGRCKAEQRIAGFLVHISERVAAAALFPGNAFELPLSQRQIGEVMSLTTAHVNRVLRGFDATGHIRRYRRWIVLLRPDDLRRISGLPRREVAKGFPWFRTP